MDANLPEGFSLDQTPAVPVEGAAALPEGFALDNEPSATSNLSPAEGGARAFLHGVASGVAGPLAPLIETKGFGVKPETIRGLEEEHPIAHGIGQVLGLGAGMMTGVGEGALMAKAGELALESGVAGGKVAEAANLAKSALEGGAAPEAVAQAAEAAKALSYGHKVGSAAVQQAAEMAVMQGSDEVSKMILQEPGQSVDTAISNMGLSTALGAGFGAIGAGVVSPLWKATAGPKVERLFNAIANKSNGQAPLEIGKELEDDLTKLNIMPTPIQRADISDNPKANQFVKDLSRAENEGVLNEKDDLRAKIANSVMEPLGTDLEKMRVYDNAEEGRALKESLTKNIKEKFVPLWDRMEKRDAEAALLSAPDESKLALRDRMIERGMEESAGNNDILKEYIKAGDQVLNQDTLSGFDKMDSQLRRSSKNFTADANITQAQRNIRGMIKDYKESLIEKAARESEKAGVEGAIGKGEELIAERAQLNKEYAQAEAFREELADHFNIKSNENARQFMSALENNVTPEQLIKKFSIKDNMEGAKFLQQNLPEVFDQVLKNEQRNILKPAILSAAKKGDLPIDINKLNDIIQKSKGGKDTYLNTVLPKEFLDRAEAGARILQATTKAKDSGTPAGLWGVLKGVATSALASVGLATGHGLAQSVLFAEIANTLGKIGPEQGKLAYLKFMGSNQPLEAGAIKSMADFFHEVYRGEHLLNKATSNVFKPGMQVLATNSMPSTRDLEQLDKKLDKIRDNPQELINSQAQSQIGHYLPNHQVKLSQSVAGMSQYLNALKPHPQKLHPLDKEIEPTATQVARYNRALTIAQNPLVVMQHIKDGTIQTTDVQDIQHLYPDLYKRMSNKLSQYMLDASHDESQIPYKTRIGLSLFMAQPLDTSMLPASIIAAQPKPKQPMQQSGAPMKNRKGANSLGKSNKTYRTQSQASEEDRANRE